MNAATEEKSQMQEHRPNRVRGLISSVCFSLKSGLTSFCARLRFGRRERHGILLLRNDALGDFMISIPLMMQIHEAAAKRGTTVTVVVSEPMRDFAGACPFFDTVISIPARKDMGSFRKRISLFRKFAGLRADVVINLPIFSRCAIEDFIVHFIKAERKFTLENLKIFPVFPGTEEFRNRTKFIYSGILKYDPEKTLQENETALASAALNEHFSPRPGTLDFLRPLPDPPAPGAQEYYLIVPGSADPRKCWEKEKFASLIDSITEVRPDLRAVMIGSSGDKEISRAVVECCTHKEAVADLCGRTTLMQLIALVDKAQFVITNDTGPLHIAALLRRRTFCLTGLGHWGAYVPNRLYETVDCIHSECDCARCSWMCRKETNPAVFPCVRAIEPEMVWSRIRAFLATQKDEGGKP